MSQKLTTQQNLTTLPAALTYDKNPTKIGTTPLPQTTQKPQPKTQPTPQTKTIPRELKIILDGMEELEGILYAMRQQIWQLYGPVDYSHISDIELAFPKEVARKLSFELKDNHWIIKPKTYLGGDVFRKVAETVKEMGGQYISDPNKKDSHFKVKRK